MEKFCLITGASCGIGLEFAKIFAKNGHNLILVARSKDKLEKLKTALEKKYSIKAVVHVSDLTSESELDKLYEDVTKYACVDILVNNAGFANFGAFLDLDYERQKALIDLNVTAPVRLAYLFGNDMKKRGSGRIINVASAAAFEAGPYMATYYASKSFVLSFSMALSEELKSNGIVVTAVCPGPTSTHFEKNANMSNSVMFSISKPACAKQVARAGYNAVMNGRNVLYHGIVTHACNVASRLLPRNTMLKLTKKVNQIK